MQLEFMLINLNINALLYEVKRNEICEGKNEDGKKNENKEDSK